MTSTMQLLNATVSDFDAVIGEDVGTQTRHDVSDAEMQIYKKIDHVAIQHSPDHYYQSTQTECDSFHREHQSTQTDFSTILEHLLPFYAMVQRKVMHQYLQDIPNASLH